MVYIDKEKTKRVLSWGVEEIFVRESLEKRLESGEVLRVKLGMDPTSPNIHLGRAVVLWKLREFQDLGHTVVFIVGDFTARIGDPSDKLEKRPSLSSEEIKENLKKYRAQVGKIIDLKKAEFHFNSKWLSKLRFGEITELAECFSVQQMSHRRNFAERIGRGEEISLREFLYPLMQGYDSVKTNADIEVGGFDQLFNLKAGRLIQNHYGKKEQDIVVCRMLEGTDGRKMSSSWGNVINISDSPEEMFGKSMSIRDELIPEYLGLCARVGEEEVSSVKKEISSGANPRDLKMNLAQKIVGLYHGEKKASRARNNFIKTFQKKEAPEKIEEIKVKRGAPLGGILLDAGVVSSKSEFTRLKDAGAIENVKSGIKISGPYPVVEESMTVRIGKHRFVKITTEN